MANVKLTKVAKSYGDVHISRDINLDIQVSVWCSNLMHFIRI